MNSVAAPTTDLLLSYYPRGLVPAQLLLPLPICFSIASSAVWLLYYLFSFHSVPASANQLQTFYYSYSSGVILLLFSFWSIAGQLLLLLHACCIVGTPTPQFQLLLPSYYFIGAKLSLPSCLVAIFNIFFILLLLICCLCCSVVTTSVNFYSLFNYTYSVSGARDCLSLAYVS